MYLFMM